MSAAHRLRATRGASRHRGAASLAAPVAAFPHGLRSVVAHRRRPTLCRTSADWWEEEEEYDAITEVLLPKHVYLVTPENTPQCAQELAAARLAGAFAAPSAAAPAEQLWRDLGMGGPPLFLKVRQRPVLDQLAACESTQVADLAGAFWDELCLQSWRMELDAGLGAGGMGATEQLLVVAPPAAVAALTAAVAQAAAPESSGASGGGGATAGMATVLVSGWNQGEVPEASKLVSWRQLSPSLAAAGQGAATPASAPP